VVDLEAPKRGCCLFSQTLSGIQGALQLVALEELSPPPENKGLMKLSSFVYLIEYAVRLQFRSISSDGRSELSKI